MMENERRINQLGDRKKESMMGWELWVKVGLPTQLKANMTAESVYSALLDRKVSVEDIEIKIIEKNRK